MNIHAPTEAFPLSARADHLRLAANFERWIGICLRAGEPIQAEQCRADAEVHARLAEAYQERKAA